MAHTPLECDVASNLSIQQIWDDVSQVPWMSWKVFAIAKGDSFSCLICVKFPMVGDHTAYTVHCQKNLKNVTNLFAVQA
jgi:hypothetical protein